MLGDIESERIHVFQVELDEVVRFRADYDPSYFARLDPGETEALVRLLGLPSEWRLCSADGIVFKVLANLRRGEQGIALEEVLDLIGLTRRLGRQYTKAFRTELTKQGPVDAIQDRGRRR